MTIQTSGNRVDARALFGALRRNKFVSVLLFVACVGAAVLAVELATPQYTSVVQLFVSAQDSGVGSNVQNAYEGGLFTQQRVQSYVDIVGNTPVTGPVVQELHLPYTPSQLAGRISASVPSNTVLINVSVRDTSPKRAQLIANAVGRQFISLARNVEGHAGSVSPVKVSVSQPASLPSTPTSPRKTLDIGIGALLGFLVVLAFCAMRIVTDTSIRTPQRLSDVAGSSVLATIPFDKSARKAPVVARRGGGPRAEAYRQLRTNLQFLNVDNPPRTLLITSAQAGDGKTSSALNLAAVCADAGLAVLVVDADLRRPQVRDTLRLERHKGLTGLLRSVESPRDFMQRSPDQPSFDVLVSGEIPPNPSELLASDRMRHLIDELSNQYDLVLLDAPPLLPVTDSAILAALCDGVILVVRYSVSNISDVRRCIATLDRVSAKLFGLVFNAMPLAGTDAYGGYYTYTGSPNGDDDGQPLVADLHTTMQGRAD